MKPCSKVLPTNCSHLNPNGTSEKISYFAHWIINSTFATIWIITESILCHPNFNTQIRTEEKNKHISLIMLLWYFTVVLHWLPSCFCCYFSCIFQLCCSTTNWLDEFQVGLKSNLFLCFAYPVPPLCHMTVNKRPTLTILIWQRQKSLNISKHVGYVNIGVSFETPIAGHFVLYINTTIVQWLGFIYLNFSAFKIS